MAIARKPNNRYSETAKELDYNRYIRENLTAAERMNYAIQEYAPPLMMGAGLISLAAPGLFEVTAGVGAAAYGAFVATKQPHQWPLCTPSYVCKASPLHKRLFKVQQAPLVKDAMGVVRKVNMLKRIPVVGSLLFLKDPTEMKKIKRFDREKAAAIFNQTLGQEFTTIEALEKGKYGRVWKALINQLPAQDRKAASQAATKGHLYEKTVIIGLIRMMGRVMIVDYGPLAALESLTQLRPCLL